MLEDEGFERLWKNEEFTSKIISIVWNEAYCISSWGSFQKEYQQADCLCYLISQTTPFVLPSATFSIHIQEDVFDILQINRSTVKIIRRSNDQPNVYLAVCQIKHSLVSFQDLDFLIHLGWKLDNYLSKFLVFFDNIENSLKALKMLQAYLLLSHDLKMAIFNSDCTPDFQELVTEKFKEEKLFNLYCTDLFGIVSISITNLNKNW